MLMSNSLSVIESLTSSFFYSFEFSRAYIFGLEGEFKGTNKLNIENYIYLGEVKIL